MTRSDSPRSGSSPPDAVPCDYVLRTDGETIDAIPRTRGMDEYRDEPDVGLLLERLIVEELPPEGSRGEGAGHIRLKRGAYPGDLSSPDAGGTILPSQTWITGQQVSHYEAQPTPADGPVPQQEPPVLLRFSENGFVSPDGGEGYRLYSFPRLADLELAPLGDAGVALDDGGRRQNWDWLFVDRVVVTSRFEGTSVEAPFRFNEERDAPVFVDRMHALQWEGRASISQSSRITDSALNPGNGGLRLTGNARLVRTKLAGCGARMPILEVADTALVSQCELQALPGSFCDGGTRTAIDLIGASPGESVFHQASDPPTGGTVENTVFTEVGFDTCIRVSGGANHLIADNLDTTASTRSVDVRTDATNTRIRGHRAPKSEEPIGVEDSARGPIVDGLLEVESPPTGEEFDSSHAGTRVLDTSTDPPAAYVVLRDGSLAATG